MTRVLAISADRSKRGILVPGSAAYARQKAYVEKLGVLDIVGFSRVSDGFSASEDGALRVHPTNSRSRLLYVWDAVQLASRLPWPDVVSVQDPFETGIAGLIISRFTNASLHVQVHTDFLSPEYARHSLLNRIRVLLAGIVLRRATRIRVVSERIADSLEKQYRLGVPVTVLPIYTDLTAIREAKPSEALVQKFSAFSHKLLFVGRLESEKHPCLALEAFAGAAPQDACLIVVGAGSEREHLVRLGEKLGVTDRVFFEGEANAAPYYHIADLVLVTSRYEGYGLVIVEALAAGKPVLSTDVGVAREVGAMVAERDYAGALREWLARGPRTGELKSYPYGRFDDYVSQYVAGIEACTRAK